VDSVPASADWARQPDVRGMMTALAVAMGNLTFVMNAVDFARIQIKKHLNQHNEAKNASSNNLDRRVAKRTVC